MLLTRSPLNSDRSLSRVRLACVRHAASVDSEPGSNSQVKVVRPPSSRHSRPCSGLRRRTTARQSFNASSLLIYWLCVILLLSLSIHERRSRNPCAVLADTRRASTFVHLRALRRSVTLRRINVLARPIQFSKNRPRLAARHPSDCSPRLVGVPNRHFDRVQGNLPTLLRALRAVNTFFSVAAISRTNAKAATGIGC